MSEPPRPYVRHVCAAHQRSHAACPAHGGECPGRLIRAIARGTEDSVRLAQRARDTLAHSPTLWVQTAHVAGPQAWHTTTAQGWIGLALSAANPLVNDVRQHGCPIPAVVAAAELGPAAGPDRVLHRAWLAGWLRAADPLEFEEVTRLITGAVRGLHVTRRIPEPTALLVEVAEVLVPEGHEDRVLCSVDLTDYALAISSSG